MKLRSLRAWVVSGTLWALATGGLAGASPAPVGDVEQVKENLRRALAYRDQAAREVNFWRNQEAEIDNLLALARAERDSLERDLSNSRRSLEELTREHGNLEEREAVRDRFAAFMAEQIPLLVDDLVRQHAHWPTILQERTRPQIDRIIDNREPAESAGFRRALDAAADVLEEAGEFHAKVNRATIMRELPDGRHALIDVIYFGLGTGYFHSAELKLAGTIEFNGDRWVWIENNHLLDPLMRFSRILSGDATAREVTLPVSGPNRPANR